MWIDQKFLVLKNILKNKNGSLLDLGSRDQILKNYIPNEIKYTGADIEPNKENTNLILDLNNKIPFENNSFDYVTALDVAEHLDDPKEFINDCLRISKQNVFIVLPNISYYEFRINFLLFGNLGSKYHFSGNKEDDRHKWFTNYYLIKKFLNLNYENFVITKVYKTRNKLKILLYLEKYLSIIFPNLFTWSLLIQLKK